jgi:hypothetical protein
MKHTICLIFTSLILNSSLFSQTSTENKEPQDVFKMFTAQLPGQGKVQVIQDDQIKSIFLRYSEIRRKENKIPGYRIRIYSNSGQTARSNAYGEKARFLKSFPDIVTYVEYETPNFKVYVGDFRNRVIAFRAYKQISKEFRNAFIVPARINLPKL